MARKLSARSFTSSKSKGPGVAALLKQSPKPDPLELKPGQVLGVVLGHRDGFGFLQLAEENPGADLFLSDREMQKVMHGDRVIAQIGSIDRRGRQEALIVRIIERANRNIVGRLISERGVYTVVPEDQRIKQDIVIASADLMGASAGQVVTVELSDSLNTYGPSSGRVVEVLGAVDDPGMEIEIAVRKFDVPHKFSPETIAQSEALPSQVTAADCKDRIDLRDIAFVTIDGEDARDFDDAVYCEPIAVKRSGAARRRKTAQDVEPGGWRLLVAIADVSHYVQPGSAIELEAQTRSTSVYFPRRVIPMLPEKLSNGLCSLNPHVDRLVLVCDMVVTAQGVVKAYQFYPAVIYSAARLTYNQVWGMLSGGDLASLKTYAEIKPQLDHLNDVFHALLEQRKIRGAMELDTAESKIVCDAAGRIEKIVAVQRNDAHRLIEECMLAANVCTADFVARSGHTGLFRVHEGPTDEKLVKLRAFLKTIALNLEGGEKPSPAEYAKLSDKIRGRPDSALIQTMMLRSMQQAVYAPENAGHFGLAYDAYTHFTSPIRRYPDLLTHRIIKALLQGKRYTPQVLEQAAAAAALPRTPRAPKGGKSATAPASSSSLMAKTPSAKVGEHQGAWQKLGINCSANERRADEASRDVEAWLKCQFMRTRVGEDFRGHISGVTTFGLFVTLDELFVEGLVHITELGGDYFQLNESSHELRGDRTGRRYRLLDAIDVQVSRVDLEARRIEFRLIKSSGSGTNSTNSGNDAARPLESKLIDSIPDALPGGQFLRANKKSSRTGASKSSKGGKSSSRKGKS